MHEALHATQSRTAPAWIARAFARGRRELAARAYRRPLALGQGEPLVSFSFDDAPRTALVAGARVLERLGLRGTYYLSLGLLGGGSESGPIADVHDVRAVAASGHELGCHTHDHLDAWHVSAHAYLASVDRNAQHLSELLPDLRFETFAYPKSGARARVKPGLAARFRACRHGGQRGNEGVIDRDLLAACFLDQHMRPSLTLLRHLIDRNAARGGWLIFATHDVAPDPSRWGCTPAFLAAVARHAVASGARVLPVREALARAEG